MITFDGANNDVYGVATYVLAQSSEDAVANNGTQVTCWGPLCRFTESRRLIISRGNFLRKFHEEQSLIAIKRLKGPLLNYDVWTTTGYLAHWRMVSVKTIGDKIGFVENCIVKSITYFFVIIINATFIPINKAIIEINKF